MELDWHSLVVLGSAGFGAGLLGLLIERQARPDWAGRLGIILAGLLGLSGALCLLGGWPLLGWPFVGLASVCVLFHMLRGRWLSRFGARLWEVARVPRWQWAMLAVGSPIVAVALALASHRPTEESPPPWPPPCPLPPSTVTTDRGHNVRIAVAVEGSGPADVLRVEEARSIFEEGFSSRVIQVAPADWTYNCHGWIFADGRYLMPDLDVDLILRDNGYAPVDVPAVGDLAIYRDGRGCVCHSALVWAVHNQFVLLESKWAWMGRYLHPPEATPYGQRCTYYHSSRPSHLLRGVEATAP
jgi:hypothetical protein